MITRFHIENYKALRDVTLELTPIHVLIGPNDSGKTSIFEALMALSRLPGQGGGAEAFQGNWQGRELVWHKAAEPVIRFGITFTQNGEATDYNASGVFHESGRNFSSFNHSGLTPQLRDTLNSVQCFRWIPSHLGRPIAFRQQTHFMMEPSGFGLALFLVDILDQDRKLFERLEERFQEFFPYIRAIRPIRERGYSRVYEPNPAAPGYGICFELTDNGHVLPASQASDGLLLVLAYLALLYSPEPPRILLIEEPENGIHPQRLKDVLKVLKELIHDQDHTQVLLTTHSPYVVDQFRPEEVTLCLKGADGAVTTHRLSDSKTVREQMDIFQLGEIWTAEGDEALATRANHQ